jgi:hypothetical protein
MFVVCKALSHLFSHFGGHSLGSREAGLVTIPVLPMRKPKFFEGSTSGWRGLSSCLCLTILPPTERKQQGGSWNPKFLSTHSKRTHAFFFVWTADGSLLN